MNIQDVTGFNTVQYNALLEQAEARGVSSSTVDSALLSALQAGRDFSVAVGQATASLPELAAPTTSSMPNPKDWVGLPSPGAMFASVILQDAAEQRRVNRSIIQAQGTQIVDLMEQQADKIEQGAMQKFACAVAGAAVNMAAGAVSLGVAAAGVGRTDAGKLTLRPDSNPNAVVANPVTGSKINDQFTASFVQSVSTLISSAGTIISSGGDYAQGLRSAEAKRLEAEQEQIRTMMEQTKQTNDALKDLIAKSLDFMNAMQANMNQTRTRILG